MSKIIEELEKEQLRSDLPSFNVGDTLKVSYKVIEGKKERVQSYEGVVTRIQNGSVRRSFTVRKLVDGVGVEKTYLANSPKITEIKVIREGKARKARLYYLREKVGLRANKIKAKDPRFN